MTVTVLHNQSIFDLAIQCYGTTAAAFDLAMYNGIVITATLTPGQALEVPERDYGHNDIVNYYKAKKHNPATAVSIGLSEISADNEDTGIGEMIIEDTFIVR